jgi:hypothetical protein
MRADDIQREIDRMTTRIVTDSNGRKHITTEPLLHPKRQWVSLTDSEIGTIAYNVNPLDGVRQFSRAIEAKLKEKNNDE